MKQSIIQAFTKFPHCLATYVCLVGAAILLFNPFRPPKIDPPTYLVPNPQEVAQQEAAKVGGKVWSVGNTGSMKPLLQGGEFVVTWGNFDNIQVGNVLVYSATYHHNPLIHRAVQKDSHGFLMAGDSSPRSESWSRVTKDNYLGTAISIYRKQE